MAQNFRNAEAQNFRNLQKLVRGLRDLHSTFLIHHITPQDLHKDLGGLTLAKTFTSFLWTLYANFTPGVF